MKKLILLALLLFIHSSFAKIPVALFSPTQGAQAFEHMYKIISSAREFAHVTVYSWSDSNLDKALLQAVKNGAKVRVILHRPLAAKERMQKRYKALEAYGVQIKIAPINMHEKFVLVDNRFLVNSSANMSTGARTKYAENFVFLDNSSAENKVLINDFVNEFTLLWNSSKDMITHGEGLEASLKTLTKKKNVPVNSTMSLYSSSMNFTYKQSTKNSKKALLGQSFTMSRLGGSKNQTWTVRDMIIRNIRASKSNIYVNLNHFNIRAIVGELIKAAKRGIKVHLMMDNQEYRSRPNNREMTPEFVQAYKLAFPKAALPVRILYYSHNPSPKYWHLNHNKTILIDYGTTNTRLLTGSYNLSRTAEHNQFDSLVLYKGTHLKSLYGAFYKDFSRLWNLNRTREDKPNALVYNKYLKADSKGQYIIHGKVPMSLRWEEVVKLRRDVNKLAPGIFGGGMKKRDCYYYAPKSGTFTGC
jgi:phosphatidylserine/phosphatidylglycerophosphate/cardiolipin synthase-like enzyme